MAGFCLENFINGKQMYIRVILQRIQHKSKNARHSKYTQCSNTPENKLVEYQKKINRKRKNKHVYVCIRKATKMIKFVLCKCVPVPRTDLDSIKTQLRIKH